MKIIEVSVCVLVYNHENFLRRSLESILAQNVNFEYEIVIGEDFSTDSSREICIQFMNKYPDKIHLILRNKNIGSIHNYLDVMQKCRGKYIAYLEGDDYWISNNKLQMQFDFLENNFDFGLVYTNYRYTLRDGSLIDRNYKVKMKSGYVLKDVLKGGFPRLLTVMHRNNLISNDFFEYIDDPHIFVGDYPIFMYLANKTKFKYLNIITAQYNYNNNSLTRDNDYRNRLAFFKSGSYSLNKLLTSFTFEQSFIRIVQDLLAEREKTIFYYSVKCKNKTEAQRSLSVLVNESKYRYYIIANYLVNFNIGITIIRFYYNVKIFFSILLKAIFSLLVFDIISSKLFLKQLKLTISKYRERLSFNKNV